MANPFATETELTILSLLRDNPTGMYGLEMVSASNGQIRRGTIYVTLTRMENKGFVKSAQEPEVSKTGVPRKIYKITALGQRNLLGAALITSQVITA